MKRKPHTAILNELLRNCKQSDRSVAEITGVSQPTVSRARQRLEKRGIIREYLAIPDYLKLGYQFGAITLANLRPEVSLKELISDNSVILNAPTIAEENNFMIATVHRTMQDYISFLDQIKALITPGSPLKSTQFAADSINIRPVQVPEKGA